MTRKMIDCRDMPNDIGCTLALSGREDEVLDAAADHAVAKHGHTDGAELRSGVHSVLKDAEPTPA